MYLGSKYSSLNLLWSLKFSSDENLRSCRSCLHTVSCTHKTMQIITPKEINKSEVCNRPLISEMISYSCTVHHMWIRAMEYLFNFKPVHFSFNCEKYEQLSCHLYCNVEFVNTRATSPNLTHSIVCHMHKNTLVQ